MENCWYCGRKLGLFVVSQEVDGTVRVFHSFCWIKFRRENK